MNLLKNVFMIKLMLFFLVMTSLVISSFGQPINELSTTSKKAKKHFIKAYEFYENYQDEEALYYLEKAAKADPGFVEVYMLMGDIALMVHDDSAAIVAFTKAIEINPDFFPPNYFNLGKIYLNNGDYVNAKSTLLLFINHPKASQQLLKRAKQFVANCDFALNAMQNPVDFRPANAGDGINSELDEYFPSLTIDEEQLLFTRKLIQAETPDGFNEDFYISYKNNFLWSSANNIGPPINTRYNEGAPAISPDGQMIVFTACDMYNTGQYGRQRKGYGSCDLFYSIKNGNIWTEPLNIGKPVNSNKWESQPVFSADGKSLYFVRGKVTTTGVKNADIYYTELDKNGGWTKPVKLGPNINTPLKEETVFIHPDGKTIYFASEGHKGFGGLDIFMSKKDINGEWGEAVNLGYPINTYKNESSFIVTGSGKFAFFASDRKGGYGGQDIYFFELPAQLRPEPVTYLKGVVFDAVTLIPVAAKFQLINISTGDTVIESFSDPISGEFLIPLPANQELVLNVARDGYIFYSDNIFIDGEYSRLKPFKKDIPLQPFKIGETMVLKNIFFDHDKYDLKIESTIELEKLIELLKRNPTVKVELGGHTDDAGTTKYNQTLSENRAKAVYQHLIKNGISAERLSYKGYGETQHIDSNATEAGKANNRRTELKILAI